MAVAAARARQEAACDRVASRRRSRSASYCSGRRPVDSQLHRNRLGESGVVAIVNERFARTFFPGENPIGKKARPVFGDPTLREIIGVVADVHYTALSANADPIFYRLAAQGAPGPLTVLARSSVAPDALLPAVRAVLRAIDPGQPVGTVTTMEELLSRSAARPRFYAILLGGFAAMAIGLVVLFVSSVTYQYGCG
jgi:hypothetical protein